MGKTVLPVELALRRKPAPRPSGAPSTAQLQNQVSAQCGHAPCTSRLRGNVSRTVVTSGNGTLPLTVQPRKNVKQVALGPDKTSTCWIQPRAWTSGGPASAACLVPESNSFLTFVAAHCFSGHRQIDCSCTAFLCLLNKQRGICSWRRPPSGRNAELYLQVLRNEISISLAFETKKLPKPCTSRPLPSTSCSEPGSSPLGLR